MIRILHVIGAMDCGGAESMIMNLYRNIDREAMQFDFVVHTEKICFYDHEIWKLGGKIYRTKRYQVVNYISYRKWWEKFFHVHKEYKIIHGHINSSAAIYLCIAKKYGINAVVHSHATKNVEKTLRSAVFKLTSYPIRYIADYFFACSTQAGIDRFGEKVVQSDHFQVLRNGINVVSCQYNEKMRSQIREQEYVAENRYVIGHVGRFTYAKNHTFLIDIFQQIIQLEDNVELWLFGEGELEKTIKSKIRNLKLDKYIRFMGVKYNIYDYLQAMDCFLFPSLFEGLGIAVIEAQAAGLPCIVSDAVQDEADIGAGLFIRESLDKSPREWADTVLKYANYQRGSTALCVSKAGYDIKQVSCDLQQFYMNL